MFPEHQLLQEKQFMTLVPVFSDADNKGFHISELATFL
jgi:hypothetical protein